MFSGLLAIKLEVKLNSWPLPSLHMTDKQSSSEWLYHTGAKKLQSLIPLTFEQSHLKNKEETRRPLKGLLEKWPSNEIIRMMTFSFVFRADVTLCGISSTKSWQRLVHIDMAPSDRVLRCTAMVQFCCSNPTYCCIMLYLISDYIHLWCQINVKDVLF